MLRSILAVIAGFAVMVVITMLLVPIALAMGTDRVFKPGTYDAAPLLLGLDMILGIIAALAGGAVCALIARSRRPAAVLACFVLVMGVISALIDSKRPDPGPRAGPVSFQEAMQKGRHPVWYSWTLPVIGAAGVLIGRRLVRDAAAPGGAGSTGAAAV